MGAKIKLNKGAVERATCPAGKNRVMIGDSTTPGLYLMVTAKGAKSWYLYKRVNGNPEKLFLGGHPDLTPDQARDAARRRLGEIAADRNPAEERRRRLGEMTLREAFTRYLESYAKLHKRTWEADEKAFERHCTKLASRRLSAIQTRDIEQLHAEIGDTATYSANRILALLSKVFNQSVKWGFAGPNPCKGVTRFKEESRERFVDEQELPRLFAALDAAPDQNLADFFRLALLTGARRGNVQAMKWADVNFSRRTWTIKAAEAKAGDTLNIYLSDAAVAILQKRWQGRIVDSEFVFPGFGKTGHLTEPKAAWKWICTKAELKDLRIHDLRRSLGSWMAAGNVSTAIVGKALGHKSPQSTAVYARMNLNPVASAIEQAQAAMMATLQPEGGAKKSKTA